MLRYLVRRLAWSVPNLVLISVVAFFIIQLPPGDFLTSYIARLSSEGAQLDQETIEALKARYGLDQPFHVQYAKWIGGVVQGDFGRSFAWRRPVDELIWSRLQYTFVVSFSTLLFTWLVAVPIGILSAVRQYSLADYVASFLGFIGLAVPNFLLALVALYLAFSLFGTTLGGLFSPDYVHAPWSWRKLLDLLGHLWLPVLILGTEGTARLIRILRANLLDELRKPYVVTARARGLPEWKVILKYPVRLAINPLVSTIGWSLPTLISGTIIVAVVLNLPTTGPMLLNALLNQDMYLAGSFVLMLGVLTVVGTLVSDLLLFWLDPRIRSK